MKRWFSSLFVKYFVLWIGVLIVTNIIATVMMVLFVDMGKLSFPHVEFDRQIPVFFALRMGAVVILIGTVFVFIATRIVVKPITQLSEAAKKVAKGDLSIRVEHKKHGNDEVSVLADNFNLMVQELSRNEYLHKDFVSNVSHEFKTPISAIKGYAEMLSTPVLTDKKRIEYATIIEIQTARLAKLSSDLLRLSELENDLFLLKKDSFSLDEQIRDAVLLLQKEWEQQELDLLLDLDEVQLIGDKALLYRAWVNLISNAIKYSKKGGTLTITLKQSHVVTVSIADNGIGMTPDQIQRVFDRFYKADEARNSSGTGLGLPIAKRIVTLHGGRIETSSTIKMGSTFIVTL